MKHTILTSALAMLIKDKKSFRSKIPFFYKKSINCQENCRDCKWMAKKLDNYQSTAIPSNPHFVLKNAFSPNIQEK
jgi:hypothetical protein